ncbi:MAG: hypothetical protein LIP77_06055 [Planctomycetes bacterium]|nr:hypothetical protein [Planctomycetota bacterium]
MADVIVSGHLRLTDTDLNGFRLDDILDRIAAARNMAGLRRLLFLPSTSPASNRRIVDFSRDLGLEVHLWYKTLIDNDIIPERQEMVQDAWGNRGHGEAGMWQSIFDADDCFLFTCPRHWRYGRLLRNRCRILLEEYDGLYLDCAGFPLPSIGLEAVFSCFCPVCLEAEPRLRDWRYAIHEMRETLVSADDRDLEEWGTFAGLMTAFGLRDFFAFRLESITRLVTRYRDLADTAGKPMGVDLLSPALAFLGGQDYAALGNLADWVKPRVYFHTYGPSSIPLEIYCLARGIKNWGRRLSAPAVMRFIERSVGIPIPHNLHDLTQAVLPLDGVAGQMHLATAGTTAPVHQAVECSLDPDYNTGLDEGSVRTCLDAAAGSPGIVLCWNILFIPDTFLHLVGEFRNRAPARPRRRMELSVAVDGAADSCA